jgi:hypothetical protein
MAVGEFKWMKAKRNLTPDIQEYVNAVSFGNGVDQDWSVRISFKNAKPLVDGWILVEVTMLFPDAPEKCLAVGASFDMYEGHRKTASVRIVK